MECVFQLKMRLWANKEYGVWIPPEDDALSEWEIWSVNSNWRWCFERMRNMECEFQLKMMLGARNVECEFQVKMMLRARKVGGIWRVFQLKMMLWANEEYGVWIPSEDDAIGVWNVERGWSDFIYQFQLPSLCRQGLLSYSVSAPSPLMASHQSRIWEM
jgi:hypothetical protein